MTEVRFRVRFMDWQKGDKAELNKRFADKYIGMGVCDKVKPPVKRKRTKPPSNKMAAASNNK